MISTVFSPSQERVVSHDLGVCGDVCGDVTYITLHTCDNHSFLSIPGRVVSHDLGVCGVTYITLHTSR